MSLETAAPISGLHAVALKAPDEIESPVAPISLKSADTERDTGFQKLMRFLHKGAEESMQDTREHKDGFAYLEAFLDRQSEQSKDSVIKHAVAGPVIAAAAATTAQVKPDLNKQLNAVLQTTGPVAKPLDRLDQDKFANNSEGIKNAADGKQLAMENKQQEITKDAKAIASKMDATQMETALKDNSAPGGNLAMAADIGLQAAGHPVAAATVGMASAMKAGQGQGTEVTKGEPSKYSGPILSSKAQKQAAYVMSYGEPTPQPIVAPTSPSIAEMNKQMAKGQGFGADLTARSNLAEQSLGGLKISNFDEVIKNSPSMKSATQQLGNAIGIQKDVAYQERVGMTDSKGKPKLDDKTQEFFKAPVAPAPSFRV